MTAVYQGIDAGSSTAGSPATRTPAGAAERLRAARVVTDIARRGRPRRHPSRGREGAQVCLLRGDSRQARGPERHGLQGPRRDDRLGPYGPGLTGRRRATEPLPTMLPDADPRCAAATGWQGRRLMTSPRTASPSPARWRPVWPTPCRHRRFSAPESGYDHSPQIMPSASATPVLPSPQPTSRAASSSARCHGKPWMRPLPLLGWCG